MDFTETEVVELRLWYGKRAYSERNDINTEHLFFFCIAKTAKEKGK